MPEIFSKNIIFYPEHFYFYFIYTFEEIHSTAIVTFLDPSRAKMLFSNKTEAHISLQKNVEKHWYGLILGLVTAVFPFFRCYSVDYFICRKFSLN